MRYDGIILQFGGLRSRRRAGAAVGGPNLNDGKHKRRVARHPSCVPALPENTTEIKEMIQKRLQLLLPY